MSTTFSIFERYDAAVKLWEFVAPAIPAPPRETMIFWLTKYSNEQFEAAVLHIPGRFRNREHIRPEAAYALVTSTLRQANWRKNHAPRNKDGRSYGSVVRTEGGTQ
jgi:hypothetical protein